MEEARWGFPDGIEVVHAADARNAGPYLDEPVPALVIVDLRAGNAGGFDMARQMADVANLKAVPVFLLLQREHDAWLAKQAGAALYRIKPIDTSDLVADALSLLS